MKIIRNIILALAVVSLCSCSKNSSEPEDFQPVETRGVMEVEITGKDGIAEDKMETVRFIVFKNALTSPTLELNECFDIPGVSSGQNEVSRFKITLEVSRRLNGGNDKIVVAMVNEPPAMKDELDVITTYNQLQNIQLDFAHFLNTTHSALLDNRVIPMTGALLTDKVYATPEEAGSDPAKLTIQRAVARIEVYIRKEAGLDIDLDTGTTITLNNTYDKEYFVRHEDSSLSFGKIQTVTSGLISKNWTLGDADSKELPEYISNESGRFVCAFYTPERTCLAAGNADKLVLDINVVTSEGITRTAEVVFDRLWLNNTETDIEAILRNNMYKVMTTVTSKTVEATVIDWNSEEIPTEF